MTSIHGIAPHTATASQPRVCLALALALLVSMGVTACKETPTTPAAPGNNTAVVPKTGTSYTYLGVSRDETGSVVQSGETITFVEADGLAYGGRTGVVRMISGTTQQYYSYAANGDLLFLYFTRPSDAPADSEWVAYPFGTRGTSTIAPRTVKWLDFDVTRSATLKYLGEELISVGGETFATKKAVLTQHTAMEANGSSIQSDDRIDTVWYAPGIGYLVKQSGVQNTSTSGYPPARYYNTANLSRYTLK